MNEFQYERDRFPREKSSGVGWLLVWSAVFVIAAAVAMLYMTGG